VGASNRIEGNKMTNEEIDVLLKKIDITKLTDRDSQEVVGYFDTLDIVALWTDTRKGALRLDSRYTQFTDSIR
jgi:hypothetical protein